MKLLFASRNREKLEEIRALFSLPGLELGSALDYPELPDVVEDGDTLEANAIKKATSLARGTGCWSLADDTGLEVEALDGAPGVYSARYAGEAATYDDNCTKLLRELSGQVNRRARFRTAIALSSPEGDARTVSGRCDGVITEARRGHRGFGYDPIFLPDGYEETFAEMSAALKNSISHRGRALRKAQEAWGELIASQPDGW